MFIKQRGFFMNQIMFSISEMQSIFNLFLKLIILFVAQEVILFVTSKSLKNKNVPKLINYAVYTSFVIILAWYINTYIWQGNIIPFVQFFTR